MIFRCFSHDFPWFSQVSHDSPSLSPLQPGRPRRRVGPLRRAARCWSGRRPQRGTRSPRPGPDTVGTWGYPKIFRRWFFGRKIRLKRMMTGGTQTWWCSIAEVINHLAYQWSVAGAGRHRKVVHRCLFDDSFLRFPDSNSSASIGIV